MSAPTRLGPLGRPLAVRASWRGRDERDSRVAAQNEAWIGWLAAPPADWRAIRSRWASIAHPSCLEEEGRVFGARPMGLGAPLLESEEIHERFPVHGGGPRMALLAVDLVVTVDVPRVWSKEWIDAQDAKLLWPREAAIEVALRECGFESVMPLGRFARLDGDCYWLNVAARELSRWHALDEAGALDGQTPRAKGRGSRSL